MSTDNDKPSNEELQTRWLFSAATGFCTGSEINGPDDGAHHETWFGHAWWSEGYPDGFRSDDGHDGMWGCVTVLGYGLGPKVLPGHKCVGQWSLSADYRCPWQPEEHDPHGEHRNCPLCDGDGYLPTDCLSWVAMYRPWTVAERLADLATHLEQRDDRPGLVFASNDAPEYVSDLVTALGDAADFGPVHDEVYAVLDALADRPDVTEDDIPEIVDGMVDIYSHDLATWHASPAGLTWADEGAGLCSEESTIDQRIQADQYCLYSVLASTAFTLLTEWADDAPEAADSDK